MMTTGSNRRVFLSYSTKDASVADTFCRGLETAGVACWMAPRDVPKGGVWAAEITTAIRAARAFVLVLSEHSNASDDVLNEVTLASEANLSIVVVRLSAVALSSGLAYHASRFQWLDAVDPVGRSGHISELSKALQPPQPPMAKPEQSRAGSDSPQKPRPSVGRELFGVAIWAAVVSLAFTYFFFLIAMPLDGKGFAVVLCASAVVVYFTKLCWRRVGNLLQRSRRR